MHKDFPELACVGLVAQNQAMQGSELNGVEDIALAEAMVRVWGQEAALKASDNACTQAFIGNDETARKWRRVMILIAEVPKSDTNIQGLP